MQKEFSENNIMGLNMDQTFQFPHVLLQSPPHIHRAVHRSSAFTHYTSLCNLSCIHILKVLKTIPPGNELDNGSKELEPYVLLQISETNKSKLF